MAYIYNIHYNQIYIIYNIHTHNIYIRIYSIYICINMALRFTLARPAARPWADLRPSGSGKWVAPEGSALSSFSNTFLSRLKEKSPDVFFGCFPDVFWCFLMFSWRFPGVFWCFLALRMTVAECFCLKWGFTSNPWQICHFPLVSLGWIKEMSNFP
jgi:hypothetical protein